VHSDTIRAPFFSNKSTETRASRHTFDPVRQLVLTETWTIDGRSETDHPCTLANVVDKDFHDGDFQVSTEWHEILDDSDLKQNTIPSLGFADMVPGFHCRPVFETSSWESNREDLPDHWRGLSESWESEESGPNNGESTVRLGIAQFIPDSPPELSGGIPEGLRSYGFDSKTWDPVAVVGDYSVRLEYQTGAKDLEGAKLLFTQNGLAYYVTLVSTEPGLVERELVPLSRRIAAAVAARAKP